MSNVLHMNRLRRTRGFMAIAALLVMPGCARFREAANKPDKPPAGPTDGNITAMLLAANSTDVSYAKLVPARTLSPTVRDYAMRMITDHSAVTSALNELVERTKIKPEENATSLSFRDESTANRELLRPLDGRQFDSTYLANEIIYHTQVIRMLDNVMIPRARDAQLRQILVSVRPAVAAHLSHAERLQAALH
jgi:putative membrane protein